MWRTPQGTRVLVGKESRLFITGVTLLKEGIEDALDSSTLSVETGVLSFDYMEPEEQLIALAIVAKGLLDRKSQATKLLPWHQATTYAVYSNLKSSVDVEIDIANKTKLRKQIASAYIEVSPSFGEYDTVFTPDEEVSEDWYERIDVLASFVVDVSHAKQSPPHKNPRVTSKRLEAAQKVLNKIK